MRCEFVEITRSTSCSEQHSVYLASLLYHRDQDSEPNIKSTGQYPFLKTDSSDEWVNWRSLNVNAHLHCDPPLVNRIWFIRPLYMSLVPHTHSSRTCIARQGSISLCSGYETIINLVVLVGRDMAHS